MESRDIEDQFKDVLNLEPVTKKEQSIADGQSDDTKEATGVLNDTAHSLNMNRLNTMLQLSQNSGKDKDNQEE